VYIEQTMKSAAVVLAIGLAMACSPDSPTAETSASPVAVASPAVAQLMAGGCGATQIYRGGSLPDWALVNAPSLPYVIAKPELAVGYLFSYPMKAGLDANTKILWYVGTPRDGLPLVGEGHPLNANSPTATFTKAADSSPGEIYPTSPTVPSAGCWHFTLTWRGGANRAEVDLLFS
jgi:hypothetical protein